MKSFTDIKQSKKLSEILPKESADMGLYYSKDPCAARNQMWIGTKAEKADIPAWSLAALLEQLNDKITDNNGNVYVLIIIKAKSHYHLYYHDFWYQAEDIETYWNDDMIDACVEMILKLHKEKLL